MHYKIPLLYFRPKDSMGCTEYQLDRRTFLCCYLLRTRFGMSSKALRDRTKPLKTDKIDSRYYRFDQFNPVER